MDAGCRPTNLLQEKAQKKIPRKKKKKKKKKKKIQILEIRL
jgi:hypothetical protein